VGLVTTCVDCLEAGRINTRPASGTPPRCATDAKAFARATSEAAKVKRAARTYKITEEQDIQLLAYQRGVCWGCRRATGKRKALARDHNHRTGEVRMRLCGPCNQIVGRFLDDPEALIRLGLALINPPSRPALARRQLPDGAWVWANPLAPIHRGVAGRRRR
jgi:hypothetical protein